MQTFDYSNALEVRILLEMACTPRVAAALAARWKEFDGEPFSTTDLNRMGKWCADHFTRYGESLGMEGLRSHILLWAESKPDEASIKLMERLFDCLQKENERYQTGLNCQRIIDQAAARFNRNKLQRAVDETKNLLLIKKDDEALERFNTFSRVELGADASEEVFNKQEPVDSTFADNEDDLVVPYQEDLQVLFQGLFAREKLVAFLGPDKSGKSQFLVDAAFRAVAYRRRVAFFTVGDMTAKEVKLRFWQRVSRHPYFSPTYRFPCVLQFPESISMEERNRDDGERDYDLVNVITRGVEFQDRLNSTIAWKACQEFMRAEVKSIKNYLRLRFHPNNTVNVAEIKAQLRQWEMVYGWAADCVVIDYADILAPEKGSFKHEIRNQVDITWRALKALSQELHCCVITATQANRESYQQQRSLGKENFSESKSKNAHADGIIGINVSAKEKTEGRCRLNVVVMRSGEYNRDDVAHCAGNLAISHPVMLCYYPRHRKRVQQRNVRRS